MPQATADALQERLARGQPVAAVALIGRDIYLRDLCRAKLVEAFVEQAEREWAVARFSLKETGLDAALRHAQTRPMLARRQVVFLEDLDASLRLGDDALEEFLERLGAYLDDPAAFTVLVLEAESLDQRTRLARLLAEKALVVAVELTTRDDRQGQEEKLQLAVAQALRMARECGVELDRGAAEQLVESLDADLARVRNEIEKLATYVGERRRIAAADVEALVVEARSYSVWQLAGLLAERRRDRALQFLDGLLRRGESAPGLVAAVAWMYRKLIEAHELPRYADAWTAARRLGVRRETAEVAVAHARRIPKEQLLAGLVALYEADARLKSGTTDSRAVLEFLVARLTAPAAAISAR